METKLTKETKETISLTKTISESILETYQELAELETNDLQDSEEYTRVISKINTSINLEMNIISKIFDNEEQLIKVVEYLYHITKDIDEINIIINQNKESLINRRLFEIIRCYIMSNPKKIIEFQINSILPKDLEEAKELPMIEDLTEKMKKIKSSFYICIKALQTDIYTFNLMLLNSKIKNQTNTNLKKELIRAKYNKIFITPFNEDYLIKNKFKIPTELYLSVYLTANLYKMPNELLTCVINDMKNGIFNYEIDKLFPNDLSYINKSWLELTLRETKLRTAFSLFTEKEITEANEEFHDFIDELPEGYFEDVIKTIIKAFKSFNNDRKLIKKLTF